MSTKFQVTFPDPLMAQLKREAKRRPSGFIDPFASITGIVDSRHTDLASRVDEIYD
jgi:hypothetical protein